MKILIAEDHGIVRQGLRTLIEQQAEMEVVGEAEDGVMVALLAKELRPDVVIMDVSMPNLNGIQATRLVIHENPNIRVIALSMYSNKRFVLEMFEAGALGYVLKSCLFDELVRAIRAVAKGEHYVSSQITDILIEDYISKSGRSDVSGLRKLTDRERQVFQLLAEGLLVKQIALRLNISPKTVDANRHRIMNKLGISSIAELTKYAIREGLTSVEF